MYGYGKRDIDFILKSDTINDILPIAITVGFLHQIQSLSWLCVVSTDQH